MGENQKHDRELVKEIGGVTESAHGWIQARLDAYGSQSPTKSAIANTGLDELSGLDMPDIYKKTIVNSSFQKEHGWRTAVLTAAGEMADEAKQIDKGSDVKGIDGSLTALVKQEQEMAKDHGSTLSSKDPATLASEESKLQKRIDKDINPHTTFTSPLV